MASCIGACRTALTASPTEDLNWFRRYRGPPKFSDESFARRGTKAFSAGRVIRGNLPHGLSKRLGPLIHQVAFFFNFLSSSFTHKAPKYFPLPNHYATNSRRARGFPFWQATEKQQALQFLENPSNLHVSQKDAHPVLIYPRKGLRVSLG